MTKTELKNHLMSGGTLDQALNFGSGEDCEIFKADTFVLGDTVLYIPDTCLNNVPVTTSFDDEDSINDILNFCYTGDDFLAICEGDIELAECLFWSCTWQHPSSCINDMDVCSADRES